MKLHLTLGILLSLHLACEKKKDSRPAPESKDLVAIKQTDPVNEEILVEAAQEKAGEEKTGGETEMEGQVKPVAGQEEPKPEEEKVVDYKLALKDAIVCGGGSRMPSFKELGGFLITNKINLSSFDLELEIDNRAYAAFDNSALIWYLATDSRTGVSRKSIAAFRMEEGDLVLKSTFLLDVETKAYIELGEASLDEQEAHVVCIN